MSQQLIRKIRSLTDKPVTHVVTSHWHGDHNFGVYRFGVDSANFSAVHFANFKGNNGYLTRDYRYLGTIGMFDSVVLPLKKGNNELWIAVSEDFGGWGVMGQITDIE